MELDFARSVAARLAEVEGVQALALGGSHARGQGRANSDLDLGMYYRPQKPLDVAALRRLAREVAGPGADVTEIGGWGPWINGGGWLNIQGRPVDLIYRDLALVEQVLDECAAGHSRLVFQPGHPHGFHTHSYLGELHYAVPLFDESGELSRLRARVREYPPLLRAQLLQEFSWQAGFWLDVAEKSAGRGEAFYVAGSLFQCAASLVQVLFALNRRFFVNEKGATNEVMRFPRRPDDFAQTVQHVLAAPGDTPEALGASLGEFRRLIQAVASLKDGALTEC